MSQKLSHKAADPRTGFRETDLSQLTTVIPPHSSSPEEKVGVPIFSYNQNFWDLILKDPELRGELERQISTLADARMHATLAVDKEKAAAAARADGFALGLEEAKRSLDEVRLRLNEVVEKTLAERAIIMREHEKEWLRAFSRLLDRFLVPRRELAVDHLQAWMRESLGNPEDTGKIWIFLSPEDFKGMAQSIKALSHAKWEIGEDSKLANGEMRCECDRGGALFSSGEQLKKLEEWIERFTHGENPKELAAEGEIPK